MSYTSESKFRRGVKALRVMEVVDSLGYRKVKDDLGLPNLVASYFWYDQEQYNSWTGVELDIYQRGKTVTVGTRSRAGRSYWDLFQQNRTLKLLRDLFGGYFETDAGRNRYWRPEEPPPSPISSGCFLARWRCHNAFLRADLYLRSRNLEGDIARDEPAAFGFIDDMNPRLLSNNLLIPYVIAVWEEYYRATFAAVIKYTDRRETVLKKANLSHSQLEQIASASRSVERAISECFSFQRPSLIARNFKMVDPQLDLAGVLKSPYRNRRVSLFDSIEKLVEGRNAFVHEGNLNLSLFDNALNRTLDDLVVAIDRCYLAIGNQFQFDPLHDY